MLLNLEDLHSFRKSQILEAMVYTRQMGKIGQKGNIRNMGEMYMEQEEDCSVQFIKGKTPSASYNYSFLQTNAQFLLFVLDIQRNQQSVTYY